MKKLTIALLFGISTSVTAETYCEGVYESAQTIMSVRQSGMPATKVKSYIADGDTIGQEMLVDAYETPRIGEVDPAWRDEVIKEFANKYYVKCLRDRQ